MTSQLFAGIDIGGTNTKIALVNARSRIVRRLSIETLSDRGPEELLNRVRAVLNETTARGKLAGAGVGCAGLIDVRRGVVLESPNLPAWKGAPLRRIARRRLGVEVLVDNDANAAGYGEFARGFGRGARCFVGITLGTGVGGSIIVEGELLRGADNYAGEIGHVTIDEDGPRCRCGNRGCVEAYVGSYGVVRIAERELRKGRSRILSPMRDKKIALTPKLIADAARRNDRAARTTMAEVARHLGVTLASLVNLLNPDCITIGGGVAAEFDLMQNDVRRIVRERAFGPAAERVKIGRSQLGDGAASVGAALMARQSLQLKARRGA